MCHATTTPTIKREQVKDENFDGGLVVVVVMVVVVLVVGVMVVLCHQNHYTHHREGPGDEDKDKIDPRR